MADLTPRDQFLFRMYDQMFNDINTHILVVWQSTGVVVGAFALFAFVESGVIPIDFAVSLFVLLIAWLVSHLYDANYWYNRNLVIIANIERQFLQQSDLHDIHFYFGKHRKGRDWLMHLRIQWWFGALLSAVVLLYHYITEIEAVPPNWETLSWENALPYVTALVVLWLLRRLRKHRHDSYDQFVKNSPGLEVDTSTMDFSGPGHGKGDQE